MLKACLNGGHGRKAHPAVPLTAAELAADAARCATLGVAAVHVHPRDEAGAESLRPAVIADALTAIRAARPGLPVGVSTGAWISPDPAARVAAVRAWPVLPTSPRSTRTSPVPRRSRLPCTSAVCSSRQGCGRSTRSLRTGGGGCRPGGFWSSAWPRTWRSRWPTPPGFSPRCRRARRRCSLHGEGPATWPVLAEAVRRGLDTRIGLEDTVCLPDGSPAADNAALVAAAVAAGAQLTSG